MVIADILAFQVTLVFQDFQVYQAILDQAYQALVEFRDTLVLELVVTQDQALVGILVAEFRVFRVFQDSADLAVYQVTVVFLDFQESLVTQEFQDIAV